MVESKDKKTKPWILQGVTKTGSPYTRYRVIHRVMGKRVFVEDDNDEFGITKTIVTKPFTPTGFGNSLFVTDFGNSLKISSFSFERDYKDNSKLMCAGSSNMFSLSAKNGKIIAYTISDGKVKNTSKILFSKVDQIFKTKAANKRLKVILEVFFKKNGIFFNKKLSAANNLKNAIFPMNEFVSLTHVDSSISREVGTLKINDFCKKMTGCKGKKTKEMLKGASVGRLQFLKLFKGFIHIDALNTDLKNIILIGNFPFDIKINKVRKFLKNFSKERLKIMTGATILRHTNNSITTFRYGLRISTLIDTVRMWNDYAGQLTLPDQPRDFDSLHNTLSAQIRRTSKGNVSLLVNPALVKINNSVIELGEDKYSIKMPEDSFELEGAGAALHNCLGGYHQSVNRGDVSILLIKKNNILSHAMSLNKSGDRFGVQQFVSDRNSPPSDSEKNGILGFLRENELIY